MTTTRAGQSPLNLASAQAMIARINSRPYRDTVSAELVESVGTEIVRVRLRLGAGREVLIQLDGESNIALRILDALLWQ